LVEALLDGPKRFGELASAIPSIAPNILTRRLRHLEEQGLLVATPYSTRPPRASYDLTEAGRQLAGALVQLAAWGAAVEGLPAPEFHRPCGTPLETVLYCPTCDRTVFDPDVSELIEV
jgi:DNA-binding HxlR family transcriptional regulator